MGGRRADVGEKCPKNSSKRTRMAEVEYSIEKSMN